MNRNGADGQKHRTILSDSSDDFEFISEDGFAPIQTLFRHLMKNAICFCGQFFSFRQTKTAIFRIKATLINQKTFQHEEKAHF